MCKDSRRENSFSRDLHNLIVLRDLPDPPHPRSNPGKPVEAHQPTVCLVSLANLPVSRKIGDRWVAGSDV